MRSLMSSSHQQSDPFSRNRAGEHEKESDEEYYRERDGENDGDGDGEKKLLLSGQVSLLMTERVGKRVKE